MTEKKMKRFDRFENWFNRQNVMVQAAIPTMMLILLLAFIAGVVSLLWWINPFTLIPAFIIVIVYCFFLSLAMEERGRNRR